jgi:Zn-dependent metalloprotease
MAPHTPLTCQRCCIIPSGLLRKILEANPETAPRDAMRDTLAVDESLRQRRALTAARLAAGPRPLVAPIVAGGTPRRMIYDQANSWVETLGTLARGEGGAAATDAAINQAYDGFGATYKFFWDVFKRDSIDGQGMPILGLVHYGVKYDNAFWDGQGHMFFGDGDGDWFTQTTAGLDVIGHELTHGITQYTCGLAYQGQSGALNEHVSDVFGALVKQYAANQGAAEADWLIGPDIVGPELQPALRSMKEPGKANAHDDQPVDMDGFVQTVLDNGGVHTNSGIPNRAFYVVATTLGGKAWERAGRIWFETLRDPQVRPDATFVDFARATLRQAGTIFGPESPERQAVVAGWEAVKVPVTAA